MQTQQGNNEDDRAAGVRGKVLDNGLKKTKKQKTKAHKSPGCDGCSGQVVAQRDEATMEAVRRLMRERRMRRWHALSPGQHTWNLQLSLRGPWLLRLIRLPERTIGVRCRTLVWMQPSISN